MGVLLQWGETSAKNRYDGDDALDLRERERERVGMGEERKSSRAFLFPTFHLESF